MSRLRTQGVSRRLGRRVLVVSLLAIGLVLGLAINASGKSTGQAPQAQQQETYDFVVSNNFVGNDWRPQVQRLAVLTSKLAPFKGKVNMKVVVAENTVQAHIQSLNNIIQTRPDAIMLIPSSDTAMNPSIKRACAAGIIVVTISAPVTEKCAWNANQDFYGGMKAVGRWMGQVLARKGNVFVDRGIPGLGISKDIENGFLAGLKQAAPNVKVVGRFDGQYAPGPEQSGIANLLVGNPDVQGVMTQGYCTPVFNAFKAAGKGDVPATCYGLQRRAHRLLEERPEVCRSERLSRRHADRDEGGTRQARGSSDAAQEQVGARADDALHHEEPWRQPQGCRRQRRGHEAGEELLPEPPCRPRPALHAAAVQDHAEAGGREVTRH